MRSPRFARGLGWILCAAQIVWVSGALCATVCSPQLGSCDYYLCRESIEPCGDDGYFTRFGYRYCKRFEDELLPRVSEREARWLRDVASCLREKLEDIPLEASCAETEDLAIDSHRDCYIGTGFCKMPVSFKWRIFERVYRELNDPRMRDTFFRIMDRCL